jgi:DNA-binding PadR family transcriptional regulator
MEQEGWLASEWAISESKRRARVYSLTAAGRKKLKEEQENWARLTTGVTEVLTFA